MSSSTPHGRSAGYLMYIAVAMSVAQSSQCTIFGTWESHSAIKYLHISQIHVGGFQALHSRSCTLAWRTNDEERFATHTHTHTLVCTADAQTHSAMQCACVCVCARARVDTTACLGTASQSPWNKCTSAPQDFGIACSFGILVWFARVCLLLHRLRSLFIGLRRQLLRN